MPLRWQSRRHVEMRGRCGDGMADQATVEVPCCGMHQYVSRGRIHESGLRFPSHATRFCGIAGTDDVFRQASLYKRTRANNGFCTDGDAWAHKNTCLQPNPVTNGNWCIPIGKGRVSKVMAASAEKYLLRYTGIGSNHNWLEIKNNNLLSNPYIATKNQLPREVNIDARLDHKIRSNRGPEKAQDSCF